MRARHFFTWLFLVALTHPAQAERLMAQYPIAAVEAGYDPVRKEPIYELVVAGLAMLDPVAQPAYNGLENCTRSALGNWGYGSTDVLDGPKQGGPYDPNPMPRIDTVVVDLARDIASRQPQTELTAAKVNEETVRRVNLVDAWLRTQVVEVRSNLKRYCGDKMVPEAVRNQARLLLSLRRCPSPLPTENYHPCNMKGLQGPQRTRVREYGYTQLFAWSQSQGARPHDEWWDLGAGKPGDVVPTPALADSAAWPKIDEATRLKQFEALVVALRERKIKAKKVSVAISSSVPMAVGLSQETAARVLDLLESPMYATATLAKGTQALGVISDEVARSRIIECTSLRRLDVKDLAKIQQCSGYNVTDSDIAMCMTKHRCLPPIAAEALANVLQITDELNLKELAANTTLPRISDISFDAWEVVASQCAKESDSAGRSEKDFQEIAMDCTLKKTLNASSLKTYECVTRNRSKDPTDLTECITDVPALKCLREHPNDVKAMAWCSTRSELPSAVLACIDGYQADNARATLQTCALNALGSDAQKAAAMLACADKESGVRAALCMAGPSIPDELHGAAECAQTSQSWESFASCTAMKEVALGLDGDLGRLASCGIQAQGDPLGTAVCMADTGLNPNQQILLQCAAASGGEPLTFAGCAGGRLALQEFIQCKNVNFGEGNCFGKNNEIRRFVRALGLPDISPNSVVGQLANAHLDVLKFQVRFAEDAFDVAGDVLHGTGELLEGIGKCFEDFGKSAERAASGVGHALADGYHKLKKGLGL